MTELLPGQPQHEGEPVFREPWEAHAFGIVVTLHERGMFTWSEWAESLSDEIRSGRGDGDTYYHAWLAALERLVAEMGVASAEAQATTRAAWRRAAARTPHGQPIELTEADSA